MNSSASFDINKFSINYHKIKPQHLCIDPSIIVSQSDHIKNIISPLKSFGITDFIFMRFYPDHTFINLATHVELSKLFFDNLFHLRYKIEDFQQHIDFRDGASLWIHNPDNMIWKEGKDRFNVGNGVSIFRQHHSFLNIYAFYGNAYNYKINNFYINHMDILENFISYFIERTSDIIQKAEKERILLPFAYVNNYKPSLKIASNIKRLKSILKMKNNGLSHCFNFEQLTRRELECLKWICQGKSSEEIGLILHCSRRTIESHISNMKSKLNCTKITQLVFTAAKLNLFNM
jgi:DNA-binding CsgD family transcriptional regulator